MGRDQEALRRNIGASPGSEIAELFDVHDACFGPMVTM
jgi:hypothetical protein